MRQSQLEAVEVCCCGLAARPGAVEVILLRPSRWGRGAFEVGGSARSRAMELILIQPSLLEARGS